MSEFAMDLPAAVLLFVVGAIASGINAVAGGGTLLSFPVLIGLGMPPLIANATNAVGLWPGSIGGGIGFLNAIEPTKRYLGPLALPTLIGSILGAVLLVATPARLFDFLVPILILVAAALLLLQPRVKAWSARPHVRLPKWTGFTLQLLVAIYGGYFGAGMGIMMLAAYTLFMEATIHEMNAVKTWLGMIINLTASIIFVVQGFVLAMPGIALALGALLGGYVAARASQKLESEKLRVAIGVYGLAMAGYFIYRAIGQS